MATPAEKRDLTMTPAVDPIPTGDGPITQQEADAAYRRIRGYLIFSAAWFLVLAAVIAIAEMNGWQFYLGAVVLIEGVVTPLFLRHYRRQLGDRVRDGEEALGKVGVRYG